jgi:hypothetical protein
MMGEEGKGQMKIALLRPQLAADKGGIHGFCLILISSFNVMMAHSRGLGLRMMPLMTYR